MPIGKVVAVLKAYRLSSRQGLVIVLRESVKLATKPINRVCPKIRRCEPFVFPASVS